MARLEHAKRHFRHDFDVSGPVSIKTNNQSFYSIPESAILKDILFELAKKHPTRKFM